MDDVADGIWATVVASNEAWTSGRPQEVAPLFAEEVRMVAADGSVIAQGRAAIVDSFVQYTAAATTHRFEVLGHRVDMFGDTAIVDYHFEVEYSLGPERSTERGREILVLQRRADRFVVLWRTQTSAPA